MQRLNRIVSHLVVEPTKQTHETKQSNQPSSSKNGPGKKQAKSQEVQPPRKHRVSICCRLTGWLFLLFITPAASFDIILDLDVDVDVDIDN